MLRQQIPILHIQQKIQNHFVVQAKIKISVETTKKKNFIYSFSSSGFSSSSRFGASSLGFTLSKSL